MAKQSSSSSQAAAALMSEEGRLYEVPVLDWNLQASKMKSPLPPRPPRSALKAALDAAVEQEINNGAECDTSDEYKTLRRTVSNRLAARTSRKKRRSIIAESETRSSKIMVTIDSLRPQVEAFEEKKKLLEVENAELKSAFIARVNQSIAAAKLTEELRLEIARLKETLAVVCLVQPQPQPQLQMQPYGIDIYQQMPANAQQQMQPYGVDFYQPMPENAQPQQYSIDFYQKMPGNAQPQPVFVEGGGGGDDELEVYGQYFNLGGGEGMNLGPI